MRVLITLVELCFFRAKVQDLPYSILWMLIGAGVLFACNTIVLEPTLIESSQAFGRDIPTLPVAMTMVVTLGGAIWLFLRLRLKTERFVQTATGIYGGTALLHLISIPVSQWALQNDMQPNQIGLTIVWLLGLWVIAVTARILQEALDVEFFIAILYTLAAKILTVFGFMFLLLLIRVGG